MATVAGSFAAGTLTITGSGYSGSSAVVAVQFTSTDNKRRYNELRTVPIVAGALAGAVAMPFSSGTAVVRAVNPSTGAIDAVSSNVSV